jgi:hypothetical protein
MYPQEILDKNFFFFNQFKRKKEIKENKWKDLIYSWKNTIENKELNAVKRKTDVSKHIFYFIDGKDYLKIYDNRMFENVMIFVLNKQERDIIFACEDVISYSKLREKLPKISDSELKNTLKIFVEAGIIFKEDEFYLSLPLNYSKISGNFYKKQVSKKEIKRAISQFV